MSNKIYLNQYFMNDPRITKPTTILNISDIHGNVEVMKKIRELLKNIKIDFICMPGDTIHMADLPNDKLLEELKKLSDIAKLYVSIGNHDLVTSRFCKEGRRVYLIPDDKYEFFDKLQKSANCEVFKENVGHTSIGNNMAINAINFPFEFYDVERENNEAFKNYVQGLSLDVNPAEFNILLCHTPNSIIQKDKVVSYNDIINQMNLILCGHNHGGLVFPWVQDIFKNNHVGLCGPYDKLFRTNAYGVYNDDERDMSVLVSNGVTKMAEPLENELFPWVPKILSNVFAPEIDLINLNSGEHNLSLVKRNKMQDEM